MNLVPSNCGIRKVKNRRNGYRSRRPAEAVPAALRRKEPRGETEALGGDRRIVLPEVHPGGRRRPGPRLRIRRIPESRPLPPADRDRPQHGRRRLPSERDRVPRRRRLQPGRGGRRDGRRRLHQQPDGAPRLEGGGRENDRGGAPRAQARRPVHRDGPEPALCRRTVLGFLGSPDPDHRSFARRAARIAGLQDPRAAAPVPALHHQVRPAPGSLAGPPLPEAPLRLEPLRQTVSAARAQAMTAPCVSVIPPVYNEEGNIATCLRGLAAALKDGEHEILVCYDFDEDKKLAVIAAMPYRPAAVKLVRNTLGRGVAFAIRAGFQAARGDVLVTTMADLSDPPDVIPRMAKKIREDGADVVSGSRYMKGGSQTGGPAFKGFLSRAAGLSLHWIGGVGTHDATTNFRAYSRRFIEQTPVESVAGFELALELTVKAHRRGF